MGGLHLWEKRVYVCGLKQFVGGVMFVGGFTFVEKQGLFVVKFYVCGWFTFLGVTGPHTGKAVTFTSQVRNIFEICCLFTQSPPGSCTTYHLG